MELLYNLERFIDAQNRTLGFGKSCRSVYAQVLEEVVQGEKYSHWIWFVFPQLVGLGYSRKCAYYGISCRDETAAYWENPILGERSRGISSALLNERNKSAVEILGHIDAQNVNSCMTLFDIMSSNDVFDKVLTKYYRGDCCKKTLSILQNGVNRVLDRFL